MHDQLKLIKYDNGKLEQFREAMLREDQLVKKESSDKKEKQSENSSSDEDQEQPSTKHMREKQEHFDNLEKETKKAEDEVCQSKMLLARLQALMGLMAEKKQGCIRFHWNRDWNVRDFQTVEDALNLKKVPYNMYLGNKTNMLESMLQKDAQIDFMEKAI